MDAKNNTLFTSQMSQKDINIMNHLAWFRNQPSTLESYRNISRIDDVTFNLNTLLHKPNKICPDNNYNIYIVKSGNAGLAYLT